MTEQGESRKHQRQQQEGSGRVAIDDTLSKTSFQYWSFLFYDYLGKGLAKYLSVPQVATSL